MKKKSYFLILITTCILAISQQTVAATYYVNPVGNDNNPGTSTDNAWQTIDKINTIDLQPGDNVLFQAGHDYPGNLLLTAEDAGTPTQPVVIGSYGIGRAKIKAGNGSGVTVLNAGGVVVENLIVMGDDYKTNAGSGVKIINELPNNQKLEYIRVHNVEASGFGRKRYQAERGSSNGYGIKVADRYTDVRIENCTTCENEYYGILANSDDLYIGYCKSYDNPGDAENLKGHSGSGIFVSGQNIIIEYCEAYSNGYDCNCSNGGPVGIWACVADNVIIQYCESHHNRAGRKDGGGFDFDGGVSNSIMQYNYSHDNDGAGYLICSYEGAGKYDNNIVRYNVSVNDGQKNYYGGIILWTGSPKDDPIRNTQIYGNTIYSPSRPAIAFWVGKGIQNTKVFNNLFITSNNQKLVEGNPDRTTATFAGNAYWAVDGKYDIAGHKSLDEWRAATGQEMLNGKPVGMMVDPKLIGLGTSDTIGDPAKLHTMTAYRLQKNSPLIDAGIDLRSQFGINPGDRDFYGNPIPQGKCFDIGAHERTIANK
jgi:hypothetical protein